MTLDLDANWIATSAVSMAALIGGLYARAIQAENKTLKAEVQSMKELYRNDMQRLEATHEAMWEELKTQREALTQNKEAVIRLVASIERLNEILPRLERTISDKIGRTECDVRMNYGRRWSDKTIEANHEM